ncbi:ATPase family AAA domain-containing protein 2 [Phytophthora cinnamomi]|uniref:ATPase family AAA domain-containing protein 2 n=1 Tax=Phytophthora cinnamomi TaxID=4785 RepID=UPI00355A7C2F|nr:ATPase family AAA domain-containing protein 2 [Phytophthora cinnamomi]
MSVLEEAAASPSSSDSSPVLVEPQRARARPVDTEEEEEEEEESEDGDTDELEETKEEQEDEEMDADDAQESQVDEEEEEEEEEEEHQQQMKKKKARRPSRRLQTELDIASPQPSRAREDASSASPSSTSRYSLRTRHSKPKRFDESVYNDVFTSSHARAAAYTDSTPESAVGSSKKRRRSRNRSRRSKRQRRGEGEDEEVDEDEEDNDDDHAQATKYEDDMSMREINRQIKAQERIERERERRSRATRYALRSRESLTMSETSGVSPPQIETRTRASTKRSQLEVSAEDDHAEVEHDGDAENESQSENEAHSEDEQEEEDGEEGRASSTLEVDRSITWDSVGGLKSHIEALKEMVMLPLLYPEFYDKYKVSPPSGVLFYGPPGTGKTLLARALANSCSTYAEGEQPSELKRSVSQAQSAKKEKKNKGRSRRHVTFYMRKGADCLSKWVGEAERQLRLLFEEAKRNQPSIIFFDEIDGLAPVRSAKQDQIHASIVSTLLALMDGMDSRGRVVVIGATNRLDAIDPALRRPGRFDRELGFKLPTVNERKNSNSHFPEEALIQRLTEAQKCLPCVLYLPQIELWWKNTTESMHLTLKMMLMNLQVRANLPILFLACTASSQVNEQQLPEDLLALFQEDPSVSQTSVVMELDAPNKTARLTHFQQIFNSLATPPSVQKTKRAKNEKLEVLPLAPLPPAPSIIDLNPEEQQKRKDRDLHFLRELRIFLSQVLDYCYSQRVYTPFYVPVDPEAVPNYYLIVKRPMDLSTMRDKLNDEEYTCFEQFMDDIQLIVRNANVFNPKRSRTRHIAHAAGTMKDNILSYAHRFRIRQGYDLFAKCREVTKRLRAYPSMYGEYGQRFLKSAGKNARKLLHAPAPEKPGVRTSARLRGVKAPEVSLDAAITRATANSGSHKPISNGVTVKKEPVTEVEGPSGGKDSTENGKHGQVAQWFGDEEEEEENKSEDEDCAKTETSEKPDDRTNDEADDSEEEVFDEGDRIFVSSRTHPGMNRPGGAGVVQGRNKDGTYNVKYILGGSEKGVSVKYIKRLTDDAVMESVKTQRSVSNNSTDGAGSVRLIQAEEKMDETDYFDELLWPLLKEEGWTRDDNFDIIEASGKESGLAVQRVVFTPGKKRNGEVVTLNSVEEALTYINDEPELAKRCFGNRYAESMMTEEALGEDSSDDETVEAEEGDSAAEEKASAPLSEGADEPMPEARDEEATEDVQEAPDFIYDEARMEAVLKKLVAKTAGWSLDKLRDELLQLNKLAYPFRNRFDRTDLMLAMEARVVMMQ